MHDETAPTQGRSPTTFKALAILAPMILLAAACGSSGSMDVLSGENVSSEDLNARRQTGNCVEIDPTAMPGALSDYLASNDLKAYRGLAVESDAYSLDGYWAWTIVFNVQSSGTNATVVHQIQLTSTNEVGRDAPLYVLNDPFRGSIGFDDLAIPETVAAELPSSGSESAEKLKVSVTSGNVDLSCEQAGFDRIDVQLGSHSEFQCPDPSDVAGQFEDLYFRDGSEQQEGSRECEYRNDDAGNNTIWQLTIRDRGINPFDYPSVEPRPDLGPGVTIGMLDNRCHVLGPDRTATFFAVSGIDDPALNVDGCGVAATLYRLVFS